MGSLWLKYMAINQDTLVNDQIGPGSFPAPTLEPVAPRVASDVQVAAPAKIINPNPGIVSSTAARNTLDQGGAQLDKITTQPDPYLEFLQKQATGLQNGTDTTNAGEEKNAVATATATGSSLQNKVQNDYAAYKAGLETLGIQSGLAQMAPGLQAGRLLQAANDETSKLQTIQQKEDFAIARAKQARQSKDSITLKSTLAEIAQIKKDKESAIKDVIDKRSKDITIANSLSTYAYKTLKDLSPDKQEAFILQTAKDNGISPASLVAALAKEEDTQKKFDLTTSLQEKSLNKAVTGTTDKPVTTAKLNFLAKNNPLIDADLTNTESEVNAYIQAAKNWTDAVNTDFKDKTNVGPQGFFTYDYGNKLISNLPEGINTVEFVKANRSKFNNHLDQYGLTADQISKINA